MTADSTQKLTALTGACHCGNIRFELQWPAGEARIPVRKCSCTFCQKHGGAWTSHRRSRLSVDIDRPSLVSSYVFGTKTADFMVCSSCGVVPLVCSKIDDRLYAVVSVNALEDIGDFTLEVASTNFDGEATASRLERRKRNWIPEVLIRKASE